MEKVNIFDEYEEFTDRQLQILERYVTDTKSHIFALRNLPEVIKGALFSRYSRSNLGLRSLLLKEFISNNEETAFASIVGVEQEKQDAYSQDQMRAIKKAQNFYDRILDGYGDDSIGELGGAHLAVENISMLAAKVLEDSRIGGSPLEKSTRYIYFDQKVKGEYLFYREPILLTSAFQEIYLDTCNMLFDVYSKLIPPLTTLMEQRFPKEENVSITAYTAALRAKVLDCLRGLLPTAALTNMGVYGNGRFFETLIHKLHCHNLAELQTIGKRAHEELSKVIPSFIRRSDPSHHTHQGWEKYYFTMQENLQRVTAENTQFPAHSTVPGVRLVHFDAEGIFKVAAGLLFAYGNKGLEELYQYCKQLSPEELETILEAASRARENRRHKSPRALEQATFTFEIIADFGTYRDLQRHRMGGQERQLLSCDYGYYIPEDILGTSIEKEYCAALEKAKKTYTTICQEFPEEAQYVVPMAYHIRWYFHFNLRALQWLCELRSSAAGHPSYRLIAQQMAKQVIEACPPFERFFEFVDFQEHDLGRLGQEIRKVEKQSLIS